MVFERKNLKSSISDNLQMTIEKKTNNKIITPPQKKNGRKKKKKMYQCLPNEKIIGLLRIFYELCHNSFAELIDGEGFSGL